MAFLCSANTLLSYLRLLLVERIPPPALTPAATGILFPLLFLLSAVLLAISSAFVDNSVPSAVLHAVSDSIGFVTNISRIFHRKALIDSLIMESYRKIF